jgi:hypothetical protein
VPTYGLDTPTLKPYLLPSVQADGSGASLRLQGQAEQAGSSAGSDALHSWLDTPAVFQHLTTKRMGRTLLSTPSIPSTQEFMRMHSSVLRDGAVLVADQQTKGKGEQRQLQLCRHTVAACLQLHISRVAIRCLCTDCAAAAATCVNATQNRNHWFLTFQTLTPSICRSWRQHVDEPRRLPHVHIPAASAGAGHTGSLHKLRGVLGSGAGHQTGHTAAAAGECCI